MSDELNGNKFTTWAELRKEVFTPEEIAESDRRVAMIGNKDDLWQTFMAGLDGFSGDIFEEGRDQGHQKERESL